MEKEEKVIALLHKQRRYYSNQQKFHYYTFAAYSLILLLDFIVIIYTRAVTLNAYAWAGIIFLFVLITVEGLQYNEFRKLKESVDEFYLRGEHGLRP